MSNYSLLNRKMNSEIRISGKKLLGIVAVVLILFIYVFNKNSCTSSQNQEKYQEDKSPSTIIYAVTPTYYRPVQKAELTRLSHLFRLVPNLFWVIVEDADETSILVRNLINRSGLSHRSVLLHAKTPSDYKLSKKDPHWSKPRGVEQRNLALDWIKRRVKHEPGHGIVYFMDDDNSYSVELFEEMLKIERGRVGVWGVGLVGALNLEKPIVESGKVVGFNSMWRPERPFPIDMAGFAISCDLFMNNPDAAFSYNVQKGYQESEILRKVTTREQLQPLAINQVLVWHTRTEPSKMDNEMKLAKKNLPPSDKDIIV
ncbi:CLUMA_CG017549, isoform A [Clunio marinus]|uniref:Galactosylgalactosylxylosylprotein 3-beta-glucuronosyltransferase n=1 Tax=Clunio marinus TaxID=568069 RepID=A0A1J1IXM3_9DIPT|nr:CLUMA_CG017549, isoform A [Clunio marinus]